MQTLGPSLLLVAKQGSVRFQRGKALAIESTSASFLEENDEEMMRLTGGEWRRSCVRNECHVIKCVLARAEAGCLCLIAKVFQLSIATCHQSTPCKRQAKMATAWTPRTPLTGLYKVNVVIVGTTLGSRQASRRHGVSLHSRSVFEPHVRLFQSGAMNWDPR